MTNKALFEQLYNSFNQRDTDGVLQWIQPDVEWPNGWEGGYVHGHSAVREYWTRQWKEVDPVVTPIQITELENGEVQVAVRQVVKTMAGELIADTIVGHLYQFDNGLIKKMTINELPV